MQTPKSSQAATKCKPSKLIPPHQTISSPGSIFQADKGAPPFYEYFQTLHQDFIYKYSRDINVFSTGCEAQELLDIAKNLSLYYKIRLIVADGSCVLETLMFMSTFLKVVHSLSKELLYNPDIITVYIDYNREKFVNQVQTNGKIVISIFNTEEEIARKLLLIQQKVYDEEQERFATSSKINKNHLAVPSQSKTNVRPDNCLLSCPTSRSIIVSSVSSSINSVSREPSMDYWPISSFTKDPYNFGNKQTKNRRYLRNSNCLILQEENSREKLSLKRNSNSSCY